MDESTIKKIFERLVERVIIPKYPFLEIQSLRIPSKSMNPLSTTFFLVFYCEEKMTYKLLDEIETDVKNLFTSAGFSSYPYRDYNYHIRVAIDDIKSDKRFYNL